MTQNRKDTYDHLPYNEQADVKRFKRADTEQFNRLVRIKTRLRELTPPELMPRIDGMSGSRGWRRHWVNARLSKDERENEFRRLWNEEDELISSLKKQLHLRDSDQDGAMWHDPKMKRCPTKDRVTA